MKIARNINVQFVQRLIRTSLCALLVLFGASNVAALAQSAANLFTCRANTLGGYVGQPYQRLQKIRPDARFVCRGCPMTMDYRIDRLTVIYHPRSKRVLSLRCV